VQESRFLINRLPLSDRDPREVFYNTYSVYSFSIPRKISENDDILYIFSNKKNYIAHLNWKPCKVNSITLLYIVLVLCHYREIFFNTNNN